MTEIYLHIDARMADYIRTHPYATLTYCTTETHESSSTDGTIWWVLFCCMLCRSEKLKGARACVDDPAALRQLFGWTEEEDCGAKEGGPDTSRAAPLGNTGAFPYNPSCANRKCR